MQRRLDDVAVDVERRWRTRRVAVDTDEDPPAVEAYRRYREWADGRGVDLEPGFQRDVRENAITGDWTAVVETPTIRLAVYEDQDLTAVHPHRAVDAVSTVEDGRRALTAAVPGTSEADADDRSGGITD